MDERSLAILLSLALFSCSEVVDCYTQAFAPLSSILALAPIQLAKESCVHTPAGNVRYSATALGATRKLYPESSLDPAPSREMTYDSS